MSGTLVIEVGTEELPVEEQHRAAKYLKTEFARTLAERLHIDVKSGFSVWTTPHRLVIYAPDLPEREPDRTVEIKGPPARVAFDSNGHPTPALHGFLRSQQASLEQIEVRETEKGAYVFLQKEMTGRPIVECLPEILTTLFRTIPFRKKMRWPGSETPFSRPVRWILALFNEILVPWSFAGCVAGSSTRVFAGTARPKSLPIPHAHQYSAILSEHGVILDPEERRRIFHNLIENTIQELSNSIGLPLKSHDDPELLDFWVHLTETPDLMWGRFDEKFLDIPHIILITAMRHHQKYLPLLTSKATLAPFFLTPIQTRSPHPDAVRGTHERVLTARFRDAEFFWNEDRQINLKVALNDLDAIQFLERGGTYRDKVHRLHDLRKILPPEWDPGNDESLKAAIDLYRVDLITHLVGEFPELEGEVGALLAREAGYPAAVVCAIRESVRCQAATDPIPHQPEGQTLAFLDRFDSLAVSLGLGHAPSGSADPLGQRRWALTLIRILIEGKRSILLDEWLPRAYERVRKKLTHFAAWKEISTAFWDLLKSRLLTYWLDAGFDREHILSFLHRTPVDLYDWQLRLEALHEADAAEVYRLGLVYKRLANMTRTLEDDHLPDPQRFTDAEEHDLYRAVTRIEKIVREAVTHKDYPTVIRALASLSPTLHTYFDRVFVMTDDDDVRMNRLRTLMYARRVMEIFADLDHWAIEVTETF